MGTFIPIRDIIFANFNDMIEKYENPEKMLRLAIRETEIMIEQTRDAATTPWRAKR